MGTVSFPSSTSFCCRYRGLAVHRFCRPLAQKALPFLPLLSALVITLVVAGIIAVNAERILHAEASVFLVVVIHNLLGLALGYALARAWNLGESRCRALCLEVGTQNSGLATALVLTHFSPASAIAGALFSVWQNISGRCFPTIFIPVTRRGDNKGAGMSSRFLPILGGTMIVAGTAIGAGMLALPMISAGMWFYWSVGLLLVSWFCMFRSSQAILEVNLHFEPGDSFHTLVRELLGPFWSTLNGLAVAFVLYTLVYAYVSGGGSVVQQSLAPILGSTPPRLLSSLLFALLLTVCVWWSSKMVDRLSVLLMGGMALSFLLSISGMIGHIRLDTLLDVKGSGGQAIFIWGAVSTYLTSFCFHASVPSLVKYLGKEPRTINACLRYGTLIAWSAIFPGSWRRTATSPASTSKPSSPPGAMWVIWWPPPGTI